MSNVLRAMCVLWRAASRARRLFARGSGSSAKTSKSGACGRPTRDLGVQCKVLRSPRFAQPLSCCPCCFDRTAASTQSRAWIARKWRLAQLARFCPGARVGAEDSGEGRSAGGNLLRSCTVRRR
eukprot:6179408-Pleurochrysis_carterae.AAC.1